MKLYIADEEKLNVYDLPEKADESFLFSYTSSITNVEIFFNVFAEDNRWYIKNNDEFLVNESIDNTHLEDFMTCKISIKGIPNCLHLFTCPSYNNNYKDISTVNITNISIGSSEDNNIIYNNSIIGPQDIHIILEDNIYYIEQKYNDNDNNNNTYINGRILKNKKILNYGDIIFINNLKLIWMHGYLRVFLPNDNVIFSNNMQIIVTECADNELYLNYDIKENNEDVYTEDDYFFHKPRLRASFEKEYVTIDPPTPKQSKDEVPLIFTLGTGATMLISSIINLYKSITKYKANEIEKEELSIAIITALAMLICSFLLPKLLQIFNRNRKKKKDKLREKKYNEYLEEKQAELNKIITFQKQTLYENNPSSKECYELLTGIKNRLWEREITDSDFLTIRVGKGNIPTEIEIKAPEKKFTIEEDELIDKAHTLAKNAKTLTEVPITISLTEHYISSIICNLENKEDYLNGILLQLLTLHNPKDLKIVLLTTEKNSYKWNFLKLTPHIYSNDKSIRYYATNEEEAKKVIKEIEKIYIERKNQIKNASNELNEEIEKENLHVNYSPYYLIITDNHRKYNNIEFLNNILKFKHNIGFSLLLIGDSLKSLPSECKKYTYVTDKDSCVFEKDFNKNNQTNFITEVFTNLNMNIVARELSSIPVQSEEAIYNLPSMLPFLEMFNVGNIEQLNILNKWASSNPISSLSCPIGVSPSGETFRLDLHEKAHGPHGLIAGSTGSGKSEFIITYLLSLAVSYHPYEVQFVLIDYKGGGLAGAFENKETGVKIPHLSGTITNLDISEINRTMVTINSELKRRQAKFNEVRDKLGESTIDIYKYQKYFREGLIDEPIPHLFIVSDEFAELKAQQPDFMDELISTARIGRSLGVHLILATQKPTGVVNDQIWSNSKFKVCLKVQTRQDSMEMLKRPEAASIKETGRFYLQVGYDELFEMGQSAWAGATYTPTDKVIKKVDDAISFINNTGDIIKTGNNIITSTTANKINHGDQLTNVVKYLHELANKNGIKRQQLWLESIPAEIYLSNIINKYNYTAQPYMIDAIIGEYDNPQKQEQNILKIDLTNSGNLLIYGIPGSGKENLITTIVTSICTKHSTDEVNIYIVDLGAETFGKFKDFPQVSDIVFQEDTEKLNSLYTTLNKEIQKRKNLFSNYNGSYTTYIKYEKNKLPNIIVIMHQVETMVDNMSLFFDKFITLFKEGQKLGITFILTYSLSTGLRMKVTQMFPNKITLKLANNSDYRYILEAPRNLVPANYFGRGIVKLDQPYEFQTAYITKPDEITHRLMELGKSLNEMKMKKAPRLPILPKFFTVDNLINTNYKLDSIPVGIAKSNLSTITYNFEENYTPILTNSVANNIHFIYALIELLKQIPKLKIRIIDVLEIYNNVQGVKVYNKDFDTLIKQIKLEILADDKLKETNIFIVIGLGAFKNNVPTKTQKHFNDVFEGLKKYNKNKFIIYDDYNSYKSLETEPWYRTNVKNDTGIWLGTNATSQYSIKMPNLTLDERKVNFPEIGYIVKNNSHTIVRYVVDKEFDNEK